MSDVKLKKYKKSLDYSYTYGTHPTIDLLKRKPSSVLKIMLHLDGKNTKGVSEIEQLCKSHGIKYEYVSTAIDKLSVKENTYALGVFKKFTNDIDPTKSHVLLVNPSNTGNVGTIIRSMNGFGFYDLVIISPAVDIFDPLVVRGSMGSFFNVRFNYFPTFDEYAKKFSNHNLYPFMLEGGTALEDIKFISPFTLIFGNEGEGLPMDFSSIGQSVYIPHSKEIDSLNLSVAVSIALYKTHS